jgi:hypothetical protein
MTTLARPEQVPINKRAVDELGTTLRGELIRPSDAGYEQHRRVWNGSIDRHPALIARCAGVADVRSAVGFARMQNLLVAVRGGGHSFPGYSIWRRWHGHRLIAMKGIRWIPRSNGPCKLECFAELDRATQAFGLAVTTWHRWPMAGVAGLTLGGGLGWMMASLGSRSTICSRLTWSPLAANC